VISTGYLNPLKKLGVKTRPKTSKGGTKLARNEPRVSEGRQEVQVHDPIRKKAINKRNKDPGGTRAPLGGGLTRKSRNKRRKKT